jgi:Trk K+ transport system NAD-binding subunit
VRVARLLAAPDNEIVVVASKEELDLAGLLEGLATRVDAGADLDAAMVWARLPGSTCMLALSEDDMRNLHAVMAAKALDPDVPVVLRAFDPALADQLQGLSIRRAFSVSALAAPAFVAAALSDEVVETLRLGPDEVTLLRLTLRDGSPILARTAAEVKRETGCAVLANTTATDGWQPIGLEGRLETPGEKILVGGPLILALRLAIRNGGVPKGNRTRRWPSFRNGAEERSGPRLRAATLLPVAAAVLAALLSSTVVVFAIALHKDPIDAAYFAVSTALGNSTLDQEDAWLKVVGVISMVLGGALVGVLFSWLASVATAQRLEQRMGRRARELSGHAVVVGLGTIGYRVERLLHELDIPRAGIDRDPDPRFAGVVAERTPILTGDVRLPESLDRTGIREARWLIACTSDDLTNIESCLTARRLNPKIRTIARIFDADLADRVGGTLGIDAAVSASAVAARAFAGAATDERAFRQFRVGELDYLAFRFEPERTIDPSEIERWRGGHVRVLAFRKEAGETLPASQLTEGLSPGDSAILAGPADAMRTLVLGIEDGGEEIAASR